MSDQTTSSSHAAPLWREQVAQILVGLTSAEKHQLMGDVERSLRASIPATDQWQDNLSHLLEKLAALLVRNPSDGLSNRDHDHVLYGGGK